MTPNATFTVVLKDYDPDYPHAERIKKILVGNQEVGCTKIRMDFQANCPDSLLLRIPMRYVNIVTDDIPEEEI